MSHQTKVTTEFADANALAEACKLSGVELVVATEFNWEGRSVDKCEMLIRLPAGHPQYMKDGDVGVCKRSDGKPGYELKMGAFNPIKQVIGVDCVELRKNYAQVIAMRKMQAKGFRVQHQRLDSGKIVMRCTR
jgi:hypothetical protein